MSDPTCATCGTGHAAAQRYCLRCGALVGLRALSLDEALGHLGAPAPSVAPAARVPVPEASPVAPAPAFVAPAVPGVWRHPATSVLATVALVAGVTAGYLLDPPRGSAEDARPGLQAAVGQPPTAASPTAAATTPEVVTAGAAPTTTPATAAPAATATAATAGPSGADAAPVPAATPVAGAAGRSPAPATTAPTTASKPGAASSRPAKEDDAASADDDGTTATGLPRIEHVWLIGVPASVVPGDGDYLGGTLLRRGTELSRYAPTATDALVGASDLVAGAAPSADGRTIADQLTAAKRTWRSYGPGTPTCADAPGVNPFLAFPTVAAAPSCAESVASLSTLTTDLGSPAGPPAFSYVAIDSTLDAAASEAQLKQVVEPIRGSAAFKRAGLIAIVPTSTGPTPSSGALLLSPFAAGSTSVSTALGPYSLLGTFQDLLGLERLGGAEGARPLGPDVLAPKR